MISKSKQKRIKIMTVPMEKPQAPSAVDMVIGALASLQASQGWAIIVKILNENIAYLEKAILEKIDPETKQSLNDAEVEILRTKRNLNIELRETPTNYSKVVQTSGEIPTEYDPYFKTNNDIIKAGKVLAQDDRGK
jgi:exosome complex RNA-binding protein Rrp4